MAAFSTAVETSLLTRLAAGTAGVVGTEFLRRLVAELAAALDAELAFVAELCGEGDAVTLASAGKPGVELREGQAFALAGTPCEDAYSRDIFLVPRGARLRYPRDQFLRAHGLDGYLAIALRDARGRPIGHIGVVARRTPFRPAPSELQALDCERHRRRHAPRPLRLLSREAATNQDDLQLMGLDHPLVQDELVRWRSVPPEEIGIAVSGDVDEPVLLSLWMVEASAGKGERRVVVQPIAVKQDGTRVPAVERLCDRYFQGVPIAPTFRPEQRNDLFTQAVEPTLQRELKHKGAANGNGALLG